MDCIQQTDGKIVSDLTKNIQSIESFVELNKTMLSGNARYIFKSPYNHYCG